MQLVEILPKKLTDQLARKYADKVLKNAFSPIQNDLEILEKNLLDFLPLATQTSKNVCQHIFYSGGKRVRPALFFLCSQLFDYKTENFFDHYYSMAAVCEFVHTASILHDDVIDNSTLRRGKNTANSIWGNEAAVLTGDLIYARASELMASTGSLDIVSTFAKSIREMSEGELLQLENLFHLDIQEDVYYRILYFKTASLLSAITRSAASLGNASEIVRDALGRFGAFVGTSFQLIDDALDYTQSDDAFGKNTLADLEQGKVTLPIILLIPELNSSEKKWLYDMVKDRNFNLPNKERLRHLVQTHKTTEKTLEKARAFSLKALDCLDIFGESQQKQNLVNLTKKLLERIS